MKKAMLTYYLPPRIAYLIAVIILFSCEPSSDLPEPEKQSEIAYFDFTPDLAFSKNLNQSTKFSLKHPSDQLIQNFDLEYRYYIDPDYHFVEYNIEIKVRPHKLSVYPKKHPDFGRLGALYPYLSADTLQNEWAWANKGLLKRYDQNLDGDIDFNLDEHLDNPDQYYALRIAKDGGIHYGWFRMELTPDSIIFKEYAYSTQKGIFIGPGVKE